MTIDEKVLQEELAVLKQFFDKDEKNVETMEKEVVNQRNNLNAIFGAYATKLKKLLKLSKEKQMIKKFKSFVKEEDLKDFEEDVLGETLQY